MANSSKDPIWQAKVTAEVAVHPTLQSVIEDKCATCHMPMGRTEAIYNGSDHYAFNDGISDDLSMDGVSCTVCHQIQKDNFGQESFSGQYNITNAHDIFGPYISPTTMPMINQTGYTPVYSDHVHSSDLCATCHTLFTPYIDNEGQIAGYLPEQTPYLEWENSIYPNESIECQTCHIPGTEEEIKISAQPGWLTTLRTPIYRHEFVGANVFMARLLKENNNTILAAATDAHFDSTISKTLNMLQNQTINLTAQGLLESDTLNLTVSIENKSGHKFPTGFPSRRAWLHVVVKNKNSETIFESGGWTENGEIAGLDQDYEIHHTVISSPDQVQIYESVMHDVDDNVTFTLLRGAKYIKDNRIPPKGFKSQHENYPSTAILGNAADDPDFNYSGEDQEGSGSDQVQYKIPVTNPSDEFEVLVEMRYQTLAVPFLQDLFSHQTDQIAQFSEYYENANKKPILVASVSEKISSTDVNHINPIPKQYGLLRNYPNPFNCSTVLEFNIKEKSHVSLQIYDLLGRKIKTILSGEYIPGTHHARWDGNDTSGHSLPSGIYVATLQTNKERDQLRLLLLK